MTVCGVVTVAHLAEQGAAAKIVRHDGVEGVGLDPNILSLPRLDNGEGGIDVAVMEVIGAIQSSGCTSSTLGASDLTINLSRSHKGIIELVSDTNEREFVDVYFQAENIKNPFLTVVLADSSRSFQTFQKGYSGSPVLTSPEDRKVPGASPLPLAMIIQIINDGRSARAVRFDAIKRLVQNSAVMNSPIIRTVQPISVIAWQGQTVMSSCPATQVLGSSVPCGWRVRPAADSKYVDLVLGLAGASPTVSGVTLSVLSLDGTAPSRKITIEASQNQSGTDWTWLSSCSMVESMIVKCNFAQSFAKFLRISIPASKGEILEIRVGEVIS
jgi:hypothetical protein